MSRVLGLILGTACLLAGQVTFAANDRLGQILNPTDGGSTIHPTRSTGAAHRRIAKATAPTVRELFLFQPSFTTGHGSTGGGVTLGYVHLPNSRRPWEVDLTGLGSHAWGGRDFPSAALFGTAYVTPQATPTEWSRASLSGAVNVNETFGSGQSYQVVAVGEKALTKTVLLTANLGWGMNAPGRGTTTSAVQPSANLEYAVIPDGNTNVTVGIDYSFRNAVDGEDGWDAYLRHDLTSRSWVTVGAGKHGVFFAKYRLTLRR